MNSQIFVVCILLFALPGIAAEQPAQWEAGVARIDITPEQPIRLSGYGNRRTEFEGIVQRLWAKAVAVRSTNAPAAVLVAVDNCGVSLRITEEVAARLFKSRQLPRDRFVICSTHTHSGPCLTGVLPNLFSTEIPADQQVAIDRYTRQLTDKIEQAALRALDDLRPAQLQWAETAAHFARNRRTAGGPVDPALPVLHIADRDGKTRAIIANYACHATTLPGEFNKVHGDWPGFAQEFLERDFPGAVALMVIGCGADANPNPRGTLEHARQYGEQIASQVRLLLKTPARPLTQSLGAKFVQIELPFSKLPTREQWQARSTQPGIVGHHARVNLARLDRGESLPATLPYPIQVWNFGDQLAMVFLAGEVVVDYSLRLKSKFRNLWVTAYANDVPCYIPSRRILSEGGYEAEGSLWYYDRPARLAPETEELIHETLGDLIPPVYSVRSQKTLSYP